MERVSARVNRMMECYKTHKESGMSNREIAKLYEVSETTLYNHLKKIGEESTVKRELKPENLEIHFEEILKQLDITIKEIDKFIEGQEEEK